MGYSQCNFDGDTFETMDHNAVECLHCGEHIDRNDPICKGCKTVYPSTMNRLPLKPSECHGQGREGVKLEVVPRTAFQIAGDVAMLALAGAVLLLLAMGMIAVALLLIIVGILLHFVAVIFGK